MASYFHQNHYNGNLEEVIDGYSRLTSEYHPNWHDPDPRAADWLFVLNTMNFALLNPKGSKQWTVNGLTGYPALSTAIKRAIDDVSKIIIHF